MQRRGSAGCDAVAWEAGKWTTLGLTVGLLLRWVSDEVIECVGGRWEIGGSTSQDSRQEIDNIPSTIGTNSNIQIIEPYTEFGTDNSGTFSETTLVTSTDSLHPLSQHLSVIHSLLSTHLLQFPYLQEPFPCQKFGSTE